jgi:hypothetical protein
MIGSGSGMGVTISQLNQPSCRLPIPLREGVTRMTEDPRRFPATA